MTRSLRDQTIITTQGMTKQRQYHRTNIIHFTYTYLLFYPLTLIIPLRGHSAAEASKRQKGGTPSRVHQECSWKTFTYNRESIASPHLSFTASEEAIRYDSWARDAQHKMRSLALFQLHLQEVDYLIGILIDFQASQSNRPISWEQVTNYITKVFQIFVYQFACLSKTILCTNCWLLKIKRIFQFFCQKVKSTTKDYYSLQKSLYFPVH